MYKNIFIALTLIVTMFSFTAVSCPTAREDVMPEYDPQYLLNLPGFGVGINIGNTLDSIGTHTWLAGETGWGNPRITQDFAKALKGHGYKTIRLPVTWAENIGPGPGYVINETKMARVEEVVNWILAEDLFCILNLHHDGGNSDKSWILKMSTNEAETLQQFKTVWNQIALRFRDASDKLILESMNEVGFDELWNRWAADQSGKGEAYRKVNALNQAFVDTVRASGGNNAERSLLIAGYWTDIDATCDPFFVMPQDSAVGKLLLSVHYYTPPQFCIAEDPNTSWGFRDNWGIASTADKDKAELVSQMDKLKVNFIDKGVPVILGEYGATKKNKVEEGRIRWMTAVTQICLDYGICPVLWDTGINPAANNHSGEIERNPPFAMTESLKRVMGALK
ncbi:MAG: glycoside hydrolase family 5 protein [Treponema sp.]|jgi:endoglucanase|nr:glycoside hydrolase family 5 protein [Treponema sp.]